MHANNSAKKQEEKTAALLGEIEQLQKALGEDQNADEIVSKHIKLLHQYNEAKDAAQILMARLAARRQTTIRQMYNEYGFTNKD